MPATDKQGIPLTGVLASASASEYNLLFPTIDGLSILPDSLDYGTHLLLARELPENPHSLGEVSFHLPGILSLSLYYALFEVGFEIGSRPDWSKNGATTP